MASAVVFAYHEVGVRCLGALLAGGVQVPLVITHEDDPAENVWFGSVAQLARSRGIAVLTPPDPAAPELLRQVEGLVPDFLFSFYYRRMLPAALLKAARRGAYNMHGSMLPKYRGRAPVNWAVIRGERETGATLHVMNEKPDNGPIVDQMAVPILPDETAREVFDKVTAAAERVLVRALPGLLDGSARPQPQDLSKGAYFGGRRPEDGRIDWSRPAVEIHNLVRGVTRPYPGAFTDTPRGRLQVWRTRPGDGPAPPGPELAVRDGMLVARAGDGRALRILDAELDGQPLDAARAADLGPIRLRQDP